MSHLNTPLSAPQIGKLRQAASDLSYLFTRKYAEKSALELVGNRYQLSKLLRMAALRSACGDADVASRRKSKASVRQIQGNTLLVDGFNILITLECLLTGRPVFQGRDGVIRDIAGIHGAFKRGRYTQQATTIMLNHLLNYDAKQINIYLDEPVSSSGKLRQLISDIADSKAEGINVVVARNPDKNLVEESGVAVTSDAWILNNCRQWLNLVVEICRGNTLFQSSPIVLFPKE